jgi:hypothetical protein
MKTEVFGNCTEELPCRLLETAGDSHRLLLEGHGPGQQLDPFNWRVHFLSLNIPQR